MQKRVDLFRNLPCQAIDKHAGAKNQDANAKREYFCLQMVDGLIDVSDSLFRKYPVWKPARGTIDEPTDQCGDDEELYHGLCRRASFIKFCAVPFMHIKGVFRSLSCPFHHISLHRFRPLSLLIYCSLHGRPGRTLFEFKAPLMLYIASGGSGVSTRMPIRHCLLNCIL